MARRYTLVNPYVVEGGTMKVSASAKSPLLAAKKLYGNLSKYFSNNVPTFYFTIQDDDKKLHHFESNEKKAGSTVSYSIHEISMDPKQEQRMLEYIEQQQLRKRLEGGKRDRVYLTPVPFVHLFINPCGYTFLGAVKVDMFIPSLTIDAYVSIPSLSIAF